ncbi:MAG TPA: flagellar biosynthesis protein FlhB [Alcaligenaceae bacterium]|nr:flagellar biosynthesis protein FlhB [Alcaligenaceae bacterium]
MFTNPNRPPQSAVALRYDPTDDSAPRVVAKGYGHIADAIIQTAKDNGLYVHESKELVSLLMQVDLDQHIPPELYLVIAELLAWLYALESDDPNLERLLPAPPTP